MAKALRRTSANEGHAAGDAVLGTGDLRIERSGHTATKLADGRVLIVGGENESGLVKKSETFDPSSRESSSSARLKVPRREHTATMLPDGRVLVIGGHGQHGLLDSTEIFDPVANSFSRGPSLNRARAGHTATVLADGRILIVGGDAEGSAEIFDPATERFGLIVTRLNAPRASHSAALLKSGKVLIAGGLAGDGAAVQSGEIFDPETTQFSATRNLMHGTRTRPTLRVLPDGKVQLIGGDDERSMEMFNVDGEYFTAYARLLPGSDSVSEILRAQTRAGLFHETTAGEIKLQALPSLLDELLDRGENTLTDMPDSGRAVVAGGKNGRGKALKSVVILSSSSATVTTDKTDYAPGETVIITGTNWQPGETVDLTLHRDNGAPDTLLSAVADPDESIRNDEYVVQESDLGVTFLLTATGQTSGRTAQTTFTDSGSLSYSPGSQSLTISAGGNGSFTQTVTAPKNNGSFSAALQVAGTGNPVPGSWVSTTPTSLSFSTGSGTDDTESWTVTVSPPVGTTPGTYTANIKANPSITGVGVGPGTLLTVTVNSPCTALAVSESHVNVLCTGASTGSIDITPSGGVGPYTFAWADGPTSEDRSSLPAGTYTVTVRDANGCTAMTTVTITEPTAITFTTSQTNVICNGGSDGSITVSASGGTGTLTYSKNGGVSFQASNVFSALAAASYSIVVKDANDCLSPAQTVTITEPTAITFTTSHTNVSCNSGSNGSITVSASGGTGTLTYSKNGGVSFQALNVFSGLAAGNYSIVVKDANGCLAHAQTVTITEPAVLTCSVSPPTAVICAGGSQTFTATPSGGTSGYSYAWSNGPTTSSITVGAAGTYSVTITDANGCTTSCSATLTVNTPPTLISVTGPSGPVAKGTSTSVTVNFTGPVGLGHIVTISWDDLTSNTVMPLPAGTFTTGTVSHLYASAGVYSVGVTVVNDCGTLTSIFEYIVIYDPGAGFVTGGGWINSLAGSYPGDPLLTGRANFGFVSKYKNGQSAPTGETEFQFQVAGFNFHSTVYEWLVVSSFKAQYRGSGTVNGTGDYGFLLTAYDGQVSGGGGVDRFRIKIWDKNQGNGVVYDNRMGASEDIDAADPQAISGGSIVVHR